MDHSTAPLGPATDLHAVAGTIAANLVRLREHRRLSMDALADRAGVSKGTIVSVEQARSNPSIATLCRLADALGVGVASLIEPPAGPRVRVVRAAEAVALWRTDAGSQATFLVGSDPPEGVELWDWTLEPGDAFEGEAHPGGTVEMLTVLDGALSLHVGGERRRLGQGDSVLFDAGVPHRYGNEDPAAVRFLMSVLQPTARRSPVTHGSREAAADDG